MLLLFYESPPSGPPSTLPSFMRKFGGFFMFSF
jgi:hypothetical protein